MIVLMSEVLDYIAGQNECEDRASLYCLYPEVGKLLATARSTFETHVCLNFFYSYNLFAKILI